MYIFAEPMAEEEVESIQTSNKAKIAEWEQSILGLDKDTALHDSQHGRPAIDKAIAKKTDQVKIISEEEAAKMTGVNAKRAAGGQAFARLIKAAQGEERTALLENHKFEHPFEDTSTSGDTPFLSDIEVEEPDKPLICFTLRIRSVVNGKVVPRPVELTENDKWDLDYTFNEIDKPARAWSLYKALRERRTKEYGTVREETTSRDDYYKRQLEELSSKGKAWREEIDAEEKAAGKEIKMWNEDIKKSP